ncbi:MAG: hypothetical protein IT372_39240 [Polyangiaceae bacterium]|nr:hypothetical protein [Polyangiaceae bacterium]
MTGARGETGWTVGGRHSVRVQPPEIMRIALIGEVSASDVYGLMDALNQATPALASPIFVLIDVTRMGAFPSEARKVAASPFTLPECVLLFIGATRLQRTLFQLVDKAYRLLTRDPDPAEIAFAGSEPEALRWIEERRAARRIRAAARPPPQ